MKKRNFVGMGMALAVAACAHAPAPVAVAAAPAPEVSAPPAPLAAPAPQPVIDPVTMAAAQRNLRALGYAVGKAGDLADPAFQRAILTFEKDQGLTEDGLLSPTVIDRLKVMRAALLKSASASASRSTLFVYNDGSTRKPGFAAQPPEGLVSNAPGNFMLPLKPGSQASYQFGKGAGNAFKSMMTVTCQAGRLAQAALPLGQLDVIMVECRGDGSNPPQWRSLYSPALGVVVRQESAGGVRDLVALRPSTSSWPAAARTGLEWALTHALETPTPAPVQWSSTGVAPHFEIRATAKLSGQEAGLGGKYAQQSCRRFEMVQSGAPVMHYPGIACQVGAGVWSLPGSAPLAAPGGGVATRSLPTTLRSARN